MKNRLVAAIVAVVLAAVGGVLILRYVGGADARAMAGMQTATVLVVTQPIPQGTAAAQIGDRVRTKQLPRAAIAPGALTDLTSVGGMVTTSALGVGEQLLPTRFSPPDDQAATTVRVPDGLQQVSVLLDAQRVPDAQLNPGDLVGVYVSLKQPDRTHLTLSKVLVTAVQGATVPATDDKAQASSGNQSTSGGQTTAPHNAILVTLALRAPDAERVVFGAEHGTIWLSLENTKTDDRGTTVVTGKNVYR